MTITLLMYAYQADICHAARFKEEVPFLLNHSAGFWGPRDEKPSDSQAVASPCRSTAVISIDQH